MEPPYAPPPADVPVPPDDDLLRQFLAHTDALCPVCRYNLRGLTRGICPECGYHLTLTIAADRPRFGWFLLLLAPIAIFAWELPDFLLAVAVNGPSTLVQLWVSGDWKNHLLLAVSPVEGVLALILYRKRHLILRRSARVQCLLVSVSWAVHLILMSLFFRY